MLLHKTLRFPSASSPPKTRHPSAQLTLNRWLESITLRNLMGMALIKMLSLLTTGIVQMVLPNHH